jgi:NAD(P)-dependent dehydrogenase (short-subunit alcohol dehydrogenase family)
MRSSARTALVTGASSGLGFGVAEGLLEKGWNVVINGRDSRKLEAASARLGNFDRVATVPGDIGNSDTGKAMTREAIDRFGRIDVLVNNAGIFGAKPFVEVTKDELDQYVDGNLKGTYVTTQAVVREMKARGRGGSIINIGTVLVGHAMSWLPDSAAIVSKGGVHALTIALAAELASDGIRVNAVAPGSIDTPLMSGADHNVLAANALLRRVGDVKDITHAVLFLAEANFITGHILNVDGGYVTGRQ